MLRQCYLKSGSMVHVFTPLFLNNIMFYKYMVINNAFF